MMKCSLLVEADVKLFMTFLEDQGYDYWFEKVTYPTFEAQSAKQAENIGLLEKLKAFVEIELCKESKGILALSPSSIRILSKLNPLTLMNKQTNEQSKPLNYYDDQLLNTSYPELNNNLNLADVRYLWSLIKTFNKYLAYALPYFNNSKSI